MGADAIGRALAILRAHTSSLDIVRAAQDVVEMLAATEARAVSAEAEVAQMESERRNVIDGLIADVAAARRERDTLAAEVKRLREELEKPVAGAWQWNSGPNTESRFGIDGRKIATVYEGGAHWCDHMSDKAIREGGKRAADLALIAAGYRLVGGVHPLPDEVRS